MAFSVLTIWTPDRWAVTGTQIGIFALAMVVGASALFWTSRDYTVSAPEWDGQVRGIAYTPSHLFTQAGMFTCRAL